MLNVDDPAMEILRSQILQHEDLALEGTAAGASWPHPCSRFVRWITRFVFGFRVGFIYVASHYASVNDVIATEKLSFDQLRKKSTSGNWYPARFERSGILEYDAARTQPDTRFTSLPPT